MVEAEEEYVEQLEVWGNILLKELCVLDRKYVEKNEKFRNFSFAMN